MPRTSGCRPSRRRATQTHEKPLPDDDDARVQQPQADSRGNGLYSQHDFVNLSKSNDAADCASTLPDTTIYQQTPENMADMMVTTATINGAGAPKNMTETAGADAPENMTETAGADAPENMTETEGAGTPENTTEIAGADAPMNTMETTMETAGPGVPMTMTTNTSTTMAGAAKQVTLARVATMPRTREPGRRRQDGPTTTDLVLTPKRGLGDVLKNTDTTITEAPRAQTTTTTDGVDEEPVARIAQAVPRVAVRRMPAERRDRHKGQGG